MSVSNISFCGISTAARKQLDKFTISQGDLQTFKQSPSVHLITMNERPGARAFSTNDNALVLYSTQTTDPEWTGGCIKYRYPEEYKDPRDYCDAQDNALVQFQIFANKVRDTDAGLTDRQRKLAAINAVKLLDTEALLDIKV